MKNQILVKLSAAFLMVLLMTTSTGAAISVAEKSVGEMNMAEMSNMAGMNDAEMSEVTGQALLTMSKQPGTGGVDFYRAGLDAVLELNTNIKKLQLGCGGINDPGCDIDIDNLSLSGSTWGPDGRPSSSAVLTRPYFEFAIKNDDSRTMREIVGFRLSAENAEGMMTMGDQQAGPSDPGNTSGLNSLSGYMKLGPTSGTATTDPRPMTYANYTCQPGDGCVGTYNGLGAPMSGRIFLDTLGIGTKAFKSTGYSMQLQSSTASVQVPTTVVSGKRMQHVDLLGSATLGVIRDRKSTRLN